MVNRSRALITAGLLLGLLAVVLAVIGLGSQVPIRTGGFPQESGITTVGCYTMGVGGELVNDPSGITIDAMGRRTLVTWPRGWTGRQSGSEVEIDDEHGNFVVRTGTEVYLPGGYHTDGTYLTCVGAKEELP
jgi:hypothetical protein